MTIAGFAACGGAKFEAASTNGGNGGDAGADGSGAIDAADSGADAAEPCANRARVCPVPPCAPEVFASAPNLFGLDVFGGDVFWTTDNELVRQPENGGNADRQSLATIGSAGPVVVDQDGIFWLERDSGQVMSCPLPSQGACSPKLVAKGPGGGNSLVGMSLDPSHVYWAVDTPQGGAFGVGKTGGPVTTYYSGGMQFVLPQGNTVYMHANCSGSFSRAKSGAGTPTKVLELCTWGAGGLTSDDGAIYFGGSEVQRLPLGTGTIAALTTTQYVSGLTHNCGDLYWVQVYADGGTDLERMPTSAFSDNGAVDRSKREVLVPSADGATIAFGSRGMYWSVGDRIMRVKR